MAILYSLNTISNARYNMSTSVGASLGTFYSGVGVSEFNSGGYCRADIGVISSGGVVTIKSTNVAPIYLDATSADALRTTSWAAPSITGFNGTTDKLLIREKLAVYDSGPVQREWVTPDPVAATSIAAGTWTFRRWLQSRAVAPDYDYENEIWLRYGSAAKDTRYDIPLPAAAPTYIDVVTRPRTRQRVNIARTRLNATAQRAYVDPVQMYATLQQLYLATTTVAATRLIVSAGRLARFAIRGRVFITRSQQYYTRQIILLQRFTHIERRTVILVPDALGRRTVILVPDALGRPGTLTGRHTAVVDIAGEGGDG